MTYLILPSVSTIIFQHFLCINIDPYNELKLSNYIYLYNDLRISCQSSEYYYWSNYIYAMIIIYPIGIPLLYFITLCICNKEIQYQISLDMIKFNQNKDLIMLLGDIV